MPWKEKPKNDEKKTHLFGILSLELSGAQFELGFLVVRDALLHLLHLPLVRHTRVVVLIQLRLQLFHFSVQDGFFLRVGPVLVTLLDREGLELVALRGVFQPQFVLDFFLVLQLVPQQLQLLANVDRHLEVPPAQVARLDLEGRQLRRPRLKRLR